MKEDQVVQCQFVWLGKRCEKPATMRLVDLVGHWNGYCDYHAGVANRGKLGLLRKEPLPPDEPPR